MLTQILQASPAFLQQTTTKREITLRLAEIFEDNDLALYLDPTELTNKLGIGNKQLWQEFLSLEPIKAYIKGQMAFQTQVAQRKAVQGLADEARRGNTQAAKQITELSGLMNQDNNKLIVLHRIPRPQQQPKEEQV